MMRKPEVGAGERLRCCREGRRRSRGQFEVAPFLRGLSNQGHLNVTPSLAHDQGRCRSLLGGLIVGGSLLERLLKETLNSFAGKDNLVGHLQA